MIGGKYMNTKLSLITICLLLSLTGCTYVEAPIENNIPLSNTVETISTDIVTSSLQTTSTIQKSTTTTSFVTSTIVETTINITTEAMIIDDPIVITDVVCDEIVPEHHILEDCLYIRDSVIHLTFANLCQQAVDDYDVIYPTGVVCYEGTDDEYIDEAVYPNTALFGHSYKSFSILNSLCVGETFDLYTNEHKIYEIQRSEEAYVNDANTKIFFYSDNTDVLFSEYDYEALILVTCSDNGRWVILAKPIEQD